MKKINLKKEKGFTLIELLVVVAIIGLLAAITLGYLGSAKKRGEETAVKSNLATTRTAIEMYFLNNGNSYLPVSDITANDGVCPLVYNVPGTNMFSKNKDIVGSIAEAVNRGRNGSYCYNSSTIWSVAVGVTSTASWCIDVSGKAKLVDSVPASAVNSTTHLCN